MSSFQIPFKNRSLNMYNIQFSPGHGGNCLLFGVKLATRDNTYYMSPFDSFVIVLYVNISIFFLIAKKKFLFRGDGVEMKFL